jgi:phage-related tail protein
MAFIGAATCGMLLTAGAAAHADTSSAGSLVATTTQPVSDTITSAAETVTDAAPPVVDTASSAVETTTDAVGATADTATKTLDTVTTKTVDTVTRTIETVSGTVDTVTKTVDPVTDDLSARVAETGGALLDEARDAAGTVTTALGGAADEVSIDRVAGVAQSLGGDHRARADRTAPTVLSALISAELDAPEGLVDTSGTLPTAARDPGPESPGPASPSFPLGGAAPALPFAPSAAGLALILVGVLLLHTTASPPLGWRRHALATIPFQGAAVALAVERPG